MRGLPRPARTVRLRLPRPPVPLRLPRPPVPLRLPRPAVRLRPPAPTVRLRLTALYGGVFLITGALLLTLGYLLVRHNLNAHPNFAAVRAQLQKLGIVPLGRGHLFGRFRFLPGSPEVSVAAAARAQLRAAALHRLLIEYLAALVAMTVLSVGAGWLLAGRALRPLRHIIATARRVSAENLGERIALRGPQDELRELADTFDTMLARLEATFTSQRHFVANASHELRTPLAIMRAEVDVALADPDAGPEELRRMGDAVRETIDRCERLIEGLLMLARSEAATGQEETVDLAGLAADCITDLHGRAAQARVEIRDELAPAVVRGQPALLERMIANLVDNGIRHNQPGGFLHVRTSHDATGVELEVRNSGAAISDEDARQLIEPFRRLARGQDGFGLGLSIVASVVRAHRGTLRVLPRPHGGLHVRVRLPAPPARPALTSSVAPSSVAPGSVAPGATATVRASKESSALTQS
jgi:signal transduction histidine kinase